MEEEEIVLLSDKELANSFTGDAYSMYMKEVFGYRLLSVEENKELARKYRAGDKKALEKLINHNLRLVVNIAHKYKNRLKTMNILDVIQEGNLGLMKAAMSYDPEIAAFSTYANWSIKKAIERSIIDKDDEIRKPVNIKTLSNKYLKLMEKNKNLTDEEICRMLDISVEALRNVRHALSLSSVSMNQPVGDDGETELGDFLASSHNEYDDILNEMSSKTLLLALKEILSNLEYYVLYERVLSESRLTLEQVSMELGVTKERVRQLESKAFRKIKPLMENERILQQVIGRLRERENINLDNLRIEPIEPSKIIKYLYVKDHLSFEQRRLMHYIYFSKYNFSNIKLAEFMKMDLKDLNILYRELMDTLTKYFKNNKRFSSYRDSMIKNYGTKIFSIDLNHDVNVVDYELLIEKYSLLSLDDFLELVDKSEYKITKDEVELLTKYFYVPERKNYSVESLFRDLNLAIFGYKRKPINVPKNKLWEVYKKNINDYNEEQRLFLECYFFNKRDKSEFKSTYTNSSLYYRYYYLIDRLERTYFNIYRYFDNNFTKNDYISFKNNYGYKMSEDRLEILDLFYGVNGKSLTISEIASIYDMDYVKMHDKIRNARDAAIFINAGMAQGLDINKSLYIPYVMDRAFYFTLETRKVLELFIIDNKSYDEISNILGLSKYRISNIITDAIRKIDAYRFGLFSVFKISKEKLEEFFNLHENMFSEEEKTVLRLKHLEYMENKDIAEKLGIELTKINRYATHFNKLYYSYQIKDVDITLEDIITDINRHISESTLSEKKKEIASFYYGIKNKYNPYGVKLNQGQMKVKFNLTKNSWYQTINSIPYELKGRKLGINRPTGLYIDRATLDKMLDDYHLPISDKERKMICYLFELKGYPYKSIDELTEIFEDTKSSLSRRYQRAIISIYKYMNKEIKGHINYEVDILPNLKYFSYSDRRIIEMYFKDGWTIESLAKEYKVSFDKMNSIVEKIEVSIYDLINDPKVKKFDFDYYMKVRNNSDLPFFGDRQKAIEIFDLFYGMNDGLRMSIPQIIKKLNLDVEQSSVNKAANNLMLAVCKHQAGIKAGNSFSYEKIKGYYEKHKDDMTYYKKQFYLRYFDKIEKSYRLNGAIPGVSYVILYDLLKDSNPNIYTPDNLNRDTVIYIIKKHGNLITRAMKRELMAIYGINPREFMSGKEINHVYKIFNSVDNKLKEKEANVKIKN